jgi:hypothetical protein
MGGYNQGAQPATYVAALSYKGIPQAAFPTPVAQAVSSTSYVDCRGYNAVHVEAYVNAAGASFDLYIEGSNALSGIFSRPRTLPARGPALRVPSRSTFS